MSLKLFIFSNDALTILFTFNLPSVNVPVLSVNNKFNVPDVSIPTSFLTKTFLFNNFLIFYLLNT